MKTSYDVVIAGGGVIGSALAYYLSKTKNLSIALVDVKKKGNASRSSAGGLWQLGDLVGLGGCGQIKEQETKIQQPPKKQAMFPGYFFDFCLKSNAKFPELWEELKNNYGVDFKFKKTGLKFIIYNESDLIQARTVASQIDHLKSHFKWVEKQELRETEPYISEEAIGSLMFVNDHQVNPFLLVDALREAARQNGVDIFWESQINNITVRNNRVVSVDIDNLELPCHTVINAAGAWAFEIAKMVTEKDLPVKPIKGQCLISEKLPKILNSCITTNDCFIVQKDNGEVLIGSTTEDKGFDAACTLDSLRALSNGAVRCLPVLQQANIKRTWSGFRPGSPDGMPILGPIPGIKGYLNASGHYKTGILTCIITAEILAALLNNKTSPVDINPFLQDRFDRF
jgi:hydrogen cyanide synthase HcnC